MTDNPENCWPEPDQLKSSVPLINWRLHGGIAHVMIAILFMTGVFSGDQPIFLTLLCGVSFYLLLLFQFALMSPRMVAYDSKHQTIRLNWRGEWRIFPVSVVEVREGIRKEDTCGWLARGARCLIIIVPWRYVDRSSPWLIPITYKYRFAIGESDAEVKEWIEALCVSRALSSD